jgi:G3E family GTPase
MIPLTLVTGFLGSGKTTLLKRIITQNREKRLIFVVNEFAQLDVDGKLLGDEADVVAIPGGSIFCHCLTATFIEHLQALVQRHDVECFDGVVIEASGMANPMVIGRMLQETGLDQHFAITDIITVTEPNSLLKLLKTLPNIHDQIASADIVLLNKIDCADEATVLMAQNAIKLINPKARLHQCINCDVPLELFRSSSSLPIAGEYAKCLDPLYTQMTLRISDKPSRDTLAHSLAELGDDLYRAKGWVSCAEGPTYVDVASGKVQVIAVDHMADDQSAIVVIGSGQAKQRLENKLSALAC